MSLWDRSWTAQGWRTQVLSVKEVAEAGGNPAKAMRRRCVRLGVPFARLVDLSVINFGFPPCRRKPRVANFLRRGWQVAPLVRFPTGATEDTVFACGRRLCLLT